MPSKIKGNALEKHVNEEIFLQQNGKYFVGDLVQENKRFGIKRLPKKNNYDEIITPEILRRLQITSEELQRVQGDNIRYIQKGAHIFLKEKRKDIIKKKDLKCIRNIYLKEIKYLTKFISNKILVTL